MEEILFPYDKLRDEQKKLVNDIKKAIENGKNILCNAPTGLGKTIAALGPAIRYAIDNNKTVFFLTSRHTQHLLALDTIKEINKKFGLNIIVADIIGKKWMCSQDGVTIMNSGDFNEYCRTLRNDDLCEFYLNTYNGGKYSFKTNKVIPFVEAQMPVSSEGINRISKKEKLCPYEIASIVAKNAQVIVTDYNYLFNNSIRENFLNKIGKRLEDSIIIIDEGHNLPDRCREMLSNKLSSFIIERAIKEAKKYELEEIEDKLNKIGRCLVEIGYELNFEKQEEYVLKKEFNFASEDMLKVGEMIREEQRASFIGSIGNFIESWNGSDKGFCRTISKDSFKGSEFLILKYKCLDPSILSNDVVNNSFSTIMMSGTLSPIEMYSDVLGFRNFSMKEYKDPFSKDNRLNLIIEDVTTKYTLRSEVEYKKIGKIISEITNIVPGNSLVFFPSYALRDKVNKYFESFSSKKYILENSKLSKEEKKTVLEKFRRGKDEGQVLLGVASGSYGEGIDLPGEELKCVIVVGVPLGKPDLETKDLIEYYQDRYGEGMNYGYIYPAITKTMQNAGRCIRSEKDRGVIVFMDTRYTWENYFKCFPEHWNMNITKMWEERVNKFFK